MALGIYFPFVGLTTEKYDKAVKQLEANGAGAPKGRKFHVALEAEGQLQVFDIWETQEDFEAFGSALMPVLAEIGVEPSEPMIATVHNQIKG